MYLIQLKRVKVVILYYGHFTTFFFKIHKKQLSCSPQTHLIALMQNRNSQSVSYFQHGPKLAGADDNSLSPGQSNYGLLF